MGRTDAERKRLSRRAKDGGLIRVFRNMYALPDYWGALNPAVRTAHVVRTLSDRHPQWVFGELSAAVMYGFEHQWSLHKGAITIIDPHHRSSPSQVGGVRRLYVPSFPVDRVDGVLVTTPPRVLVDCARFLDFHHALPIFDSAFARGTTVRQVMDLCADIGDGLVPVMRLLRHADGRSDNGGESLMRGIIIDSGFMVPEIQVTFVDPLTGKRYRVDFVWRLADGRVIVAEFDGRAKYVDPSMTGGEDYMNVFQRERDREDALRRAGVTKVIRFTYQDLIHVERLISKLVAAGIPQC